MLVRVSRVLHSTPELIPEATEVHSKHAEVADSGSCAAEVASAVVSPQMHASPAMTQTAVSTADAGLCVYVSSCMYAPCS